MRFEGMESNESFSMMEEFILLIDDKNIRRRFEDAIGYRKPFQNFKQLLFDYPDLRDQWFAYKNQYYIDFVIEQLDAYNQKDKGDDEKADGECLKNNFFY